MRVTTIFLVYAASLVLSANAVAQASLNAPLPNVGANIPLNPAPTANPNSNPIPKGPAGNVDKVLERISRNLLPQADMIDSQAEASINRDLNLSRSTGQLLRPVGYIQVGDERAIFASEDGVRFLKLKEQSRLGVMKIAKISEDGVEYKVSGKDMYAPIAYTATEAPKQPQVSGNTASQGQQQITPTMQQNQGVAFQSLR